MPEVRDTDPYARFSAMEVGQLHLELQNLQQKCGGNYSALSDDDLTNVIAITRAIRKKAAAPTTTSAGPRKARTPKAKVTIDALA